MGLKSRMKGKVGEREACAYLRSLGFASAQRTAQCRGGKDSADVACDELPYIHFEVKYGYPPTALNVTTELLRAAYRQACADANPKSYPVVLWRSKGGKNWCLTIRTNLGMATICGDEANKDALITLNMDAGFNELGRMCQNTPQPT